MRSCDACRCPPPCRHACLRPAPGRSHDRRGEWSPRRAPPPPACCGRRPVPRVRPAAAGCRADAGRWWVRPAHSRRRADWSPAAPPIAGAASRHRKVWGQRDPAQVGQPHASQELQSRGDFGEQVLADGRFARVQFQLLQEHTQRCHRQRSQLRDGLVAELNRQRGFVEALAIAGRAGHVLTLHVFPGPSSPVCSASNSSILRPVPKHAVHQPRALLYENICGSGSAKPLPQFVHARARRNERSALPSAAPWTCTMPLPSSRPRSQHCAQRGFIGARDAQLSQRQLDVVHPCIAPAWATWPLAPALHPRAGASGPAPRPTGPVPGSGPCAR